jgi:hypothetical protein
LGKTNTKKKEKKKKEEEVTSSAISGRPLAKIQNQLLSLLCR